jgi:nucleotide-binding universal stress UspA family protein
MTRFGVPPGSIVVGVDGSEDSDRAVTWAAGQAVLERRELAIVHSADELSLRDSVWLDSQGIDHRELKTALNEAARATVNAAREVATSAAPRVEVFTALVGTDPRLALVDLSEEAHLVALGSRGRGPVRTALLGSVSASVARQAHCPVVVCRPPGDATPASNRVVVGADGSPASRPVLEFAFEQASLLQAPLTVMHCFWDVLVATRGPGLVTPGESEDLSDLRLLLAQSVAGFAEKYPDVEVTQELARGLVDECLVDHAPDAGLLVVGRSRAPSGWSRFLHASCSLAVLERAHTTVAVVPESV